MPGMFDNYENLSNSYVPNNLSCAKPQHNCTPIAPSNPNKPYSDYNAKGELVGYFWHYGDSINLEFNIEGEMTTQEDYIEAKDFLINKYAQFKLYNFRHEPIYELTTPKFTGDTATVIIPIDVELSKKLVKGIYYCSLSISDGFDYYQTLIGNGDIPSIQFTVR